jgi:hypothetical protein
MSEYEALVREQLEQLGYNSEAIPDGVLREFLADFEQMDVSDEAAGTASNSLSYPSALSSHEAESVAAPPPSDPKARPAAVKSSGAARDGNANRARGVRKVGSAQPSGARPRTAPSPSLSRSAVHDDVLASPPLAHSGEHAGAMNADVDGFAAPLDFEPTSPKASLRSTSAMSPRPSSARPGSARLLSSSSLVAGGAAVPLTGFAGSGVIISASSSTIYGGTPRQCKSDPVSMHAKRQQQWGSDSFLSHSRSKSKMASSIAPPSPMATVAATRRRINSYVVPTTKRRDDVVWQTRQRMRQSDTDARGRVQSRGKSIKPNTFVPVTEKRRDDLRWAVRSEMAWIS